MLHTFACHCFAIFHCALSQSDSQHFSLVTYRLSGATSKWIFWLLMQIPRKSCCLQSFLLGHSTKVFLSAWQLIVRFIAGTRIQCKRAKINAVRSLSLLVCCDSVYFSASKVDNLNTVCICC